eukprot:jgi/Bigna1/74320/fgenesh1_pg.28_\
MALFDLCLLLVVIIVIIIIMIYMMSHLNLDATKTSSPNAFFLFVFSSVSVVIVIITTTTIITSPSSQVWNNRAACYQKLYELRLGIKDSEKAVELDPNYVKGWSRLGQMYYGVKDLVKAKRAFQRMQEIEPGNTDAQKGLDMVATMEQTTPADPNEVQRRVQNDPEAMSIMQDPQMQKVLQELQSNPSSAQKWMADPIVSRKLQKLIDVGVIRTSPAPP